MISSSHHSLFVSFPCSSSVLHSRLLFITAFIWCSYYCHYSNDVSYQWVSGSSNNESNFCSSIIIHLWPMYECCQWAKKVHWLAEKTDAAKLKLASESMEH
jgi:hypothetical protein